MTDRFPGFAASVMMRRLKSALRPSWLPRHQRRLHLHGTLLFSSLLCRCCYIAHGRRAARLRQTLGGRSGGPLVRSIVRLWPCKKAAARLHAAQQMCSGSGANPAAGLQIDGRNHAGLVARLCSVHVEERQVQSKMKYWRFGRKGRDFTRAR